MIKRFIDALGGVFNDLPYLIDGGSSRSFGVRNSTLRKIYDPFYDAVFAGSGVAQSERGIAVQVGPYLLAGTYSAYGYEIGYRMVTTNCVILRDREELFRFERDGIEIEVTPETGTRHCYVAPGNWQKDFQHTLRTQPAKAVFFDRKLLNPLPIQVQDGLFPPITNNPPALPEYSPLANVSTPGVSDTITKPSNPNQEFNAAQILARALRKMRRGPSAGTGGNPTP